MLLVVVVAYQKTHYYSVIMPMPIHAPSPIKCSAYSQPTSQFMGLLSSTCCCRCLSPALLLIKTLFHCSAIFTVAANASLGSMALANGANRKHRGVDGLHCSSDIWVNLPAHRIMGCQVDRLDDRLRSLLKSPAAISGLVCLL